jgi:hypothetical protein
MENTSNTTASVRRSPRIAELNARKEMEQSLKESKLAEYLNEDSNNYSISKEITKNDASQRYTCAQWSFMIADLTMALVNLGFIIHWIYR